MKRLVQFIVRQSGIAAFLCVGFAFLQGFRVCEGLWQGVGLHGYIIELGKARSGLVVSVWTAFTQMLAALGIAGLFGVIARWQSGMGFGLGKAGIIENPGRENVLRTKRRQSRPKR